MKDDIMQRLKTLIVKLRLGGISGFWNILKYNLYNQGKVIRWQLDLDAWSSAGEMPAPLQVRRGNLPELTEYRASATEALPYEDFYADQIYGLQWFYLGLWESQIAHISWISPQVCTMSISLRPGEVEIRNVQTLKTFRGRRIFTYVLSYMLADLRQADVHTVYAHVDHNNTPSLKAFARSGFQPVEVIIWKRIFGIELLHRQPCESENIVGVGSRPIALP